jgi:hypothetical protein
MTRNVILEGRRLEPVRDALPVGFDALRAEALAEGFRQVERLAADWEAGTTRFDRDGGAPRAQWCSRRHRS